MELKSTLKSEVYHSLVEYLTKSEMHCTVIDLTGISGIRQKQNFLQHKSSEWGKTVAASVGYQYIHGQGSCELLPFCE